MRSASPRRLRPASASRIASYSPASSFCKRVSTLPRMSRTVTSGRACSNCDWRRRLPVPTRAPLGSCSMAGSLVRDKGVARAFAWRNGGQAQAFDAFRRQVLQAVHGQIDSPVQQGSLNLFGEHALAAALGDGRRRAVTAGLDEDQFDGCTEFGQAGGDPFGLPAREGAGSRAKADRGVSWRIRDCRSAGRHLFHFRLTRCRRRAGQSPRRRWLLILSVSALLCCCFGTTTPQLTMN